MHVCAVPPHQWPVKTFFIDKSFPYYQRVNNMGKTKIKGKGKHPNSIKALKHIKPGQVLNPIGGQAHNPELRRLKQMTREELAEVGGLVVQQNISELEAVAKSKTHSALQVWFATIALEAIKQKQTGLMNALLDRIVGKIPEKIELTGADGGPLTSQSASLAMQGLMSDPESFEAMATLERKLSGFQPGKRKP